jgi:hypothetical protein
MLLIRDELSNYLLSIFTRLTTANHLMTANLLETERVHCSSLCLLSFSSIYYNFEGLRTEAYSSSTLFLGSSRRACVSSNNRGKPVSLNVASLRRNFAIACPHKNIWGIPWPVKPPMINMPGRPGIGPSRGSLSDEYPMTSLMLAAARVQCNALIRLTSGPYIIDIRSTVLPSMKMPLHIAIKVGSRFMDDLSIINIPIP